MNLATHQVTKTHHKHPVRCLALHWDYKNQARLALAVNDKLIVSTKGFFGVSDEVIHSGEGIVTTVAYQDPFVAWANDKGDLSI